MKTPRLRVRPMHERDIPQIMALSERIYGSGSGWSARQLASHLDMFAGGQLVAVRPDGKGEGEKLLGMAASLIIAWDDYELTDTWRDYTDSGMFTNHDPVRGRTLYGAEVMTDPTERGRGIGSSLYLARQRLVERLGLRRIRAGSRLRGYHRVAAEMTASRYVEDVITGLRRDPTLSFQLRRGFKVLGVVGGYLKSDPESLGWAAVIDWTREEAEAK